MAKELPYFRFTVSEWMNGDISMEDYECKGLFADICAWYWFKDCSVTKVMLEKKFSNVRLVQMLYDSEVLKVDGENIQIEFLDEQFNTLSSILKSRQDAGRKGGKQKSSNAKAKLKQKSSNAKAKLKQKSSYKDKDKDKDKDNIPPFSEFKEYALNKKPNVNYEALQFKYESWKISGWKDGNGKQIKNWKSKLLNTLPYIKEQVDKFHPSEAPVQNLLE